MIYNNICVYDNDGKLLCYMEKLQKQFDNLNEAKLWAFDQSIDVLKQRKKTDGFVVIFQDEEKIGKKISLKFNKYKKLKGWEVIK